MDLDEMRMREKANSHARSMLKGNNEYFYYQDQPTRDYLIERLDSVLCKNHNNLNALERKGYLLALSKKYKEAIGCYKQCETLLSENWYRLGLCHCCLGNFEEAKKSYDIVIKIAYENGIYYKTLYNQALLLIQFLKEDYQVALEYIEKVLKYKPTDFDAWVIKGNILKQLGNDKKAQECYAKSNYLLKISSMNRLEKIKYSLINFFRKEYIEDRVYPLFKDFKSYGWGTFDYFKEVQND